MATEYRTQGAVSPCINLRKTRKYTVMREAVRHTLFACLRGVYTNKHSTKYIRGVTYNKPRGLLHKIVRFEMDLPCYRWVGF